MNRRQFLKAMSAAGMATFAPSSMLSMYKNASAAVNYAGAIVNAPSVMPQVINVFLYGGPSELAGNLSNIQDIHDNSQNSYETAFGTRITQFDDNGTGANGFVTKNGFWRGNDALGTGGQQGAGGLDMQFMHDRQYMSVYRTLMKRLDGTRSHRESILMSQKGSLDIEVSAGLGTKIAATLMQHRALFENQPGVTTADGLQIPDLEELFLPFISFEGESRIFSLDPDVQIPLRLRGLTLDTNLVSPYSRGLLTNDGEITALVDKVVTAADNARYAGVANAFALRQFLADKMADLDPNQVVPPVTVSATTDSSGTALPTVTDPLDYAGLNAVAPVQLSYPGGSFSDSIRAAVTLALKNPSTLFISVGGGLGGWDDHNNATTDYPNRMANVMDVMKAAMLHIKYSNTAAVLGGGNRTTSSNIAINMFGDFGRLVNLNGAQGGWDHGNNQNFYTFGFDDAGLGSPRPVGALGKVVGETIRVGEGGQNNQVTEPSPDVGGGVPSYEAEPMSVAATVYSYFGVQNPAILTADAMLNPVGVPAITETTGAAPDLFIPI